MTVEVKPGFWWKRDRHWAFIAKREAVGGFLWAGIDNLGFRRGWADDGKWANHDSCTDLVEYIGMTHPGCDTRPKPEPKWRPYRESDFVNGFTIVGKVIQSVSETREYVILSRYELDIRIAASQDGPFHSLSTRQLLMSYKFLDGTPCGIMEDENAPTDMEAR